MINTIKLSPLYSFECNVEVNNSYRWDDAFIEYGKIGADYECYFDSANETNNYSIICRRFYDEVNDTYETDYNTFIEYDIDFSNENWKGELENALIKAMIEFYNL